MFGPIKDERTVKGKTESFKNYLMKITFQRRSRKEGCAGQEMQSELSTKNGFGTWNLVDKKPSGRPKLRWEDIVKRDIEKLGGEMNWKELAMNRDGWRIGCKTGWS